MADHLVELCNRLRCLSEALPTKETPPESRQAFIERAKKVSKSKIKDYDKPRARQRRKAIAPIASKYKVKMKSPTGKKSVEKVIKDIKKARHSLNIKNPSSIPKTKPAAVVSRKSYSKTSQNRPRKIHGGGGPGPAASGAAKVPGRPGRGYDPSVDEDRMYLPFTLRAMGPLAEDLLLEKKGKYSRRKRSQIEKAFPEKAGDSKAPKAPPAAPSPNKKKKKEGFRALRKKGKLKQHKEKKDGKKKSKYSNPTTFKSCPKGAMISSPTLRYQIPLNRFVNPDPDWPTYPVRPKCRASMAALGRALQMSGPKTKRKGGKVVRGPETDPATTSQVISRVNKGGIRGSRRIRLWGTGVGGERMETHRGLPGTPKRHPEYGESTGERDERLHTAKSEHGKPFNRPVPRAGKFRKPEKKKKESKRKQRRKEAQQKVTIARGKRTIGRQVPAHAGMRPQPEGKGSQEAQKFLDRLRADRSPKKTHRKSKSQKKKSKK